MTGTYPKPKHGWTCFHCGETFTTVGSAADHFGDADAEPGCMIRVQDGEERGLLMALRAAEAEVDRLRAIDDQRDNDLYLYGAMQSELARRFNGARTVHQAFLVLDAMEGRALAAEERAAELQAGLLAAADLGGKLLSGGAS